MSDNTVNALLVKWCINLLLSLILILNIMYKPEFSSFIDYELISITCALVVVAVFIHLFITHQRNYFRLDTLFILGFLIVHFQWPAMLSISGIEPQRMTELSSNFLYMNYGTWLSSLGLCCWILAFNIAEFDRREVINIYQIDNRPLFYFSTVMFFGFLAFAGQDFLTGAVYKEVGSADAISGVAGYILIFLHISILCLAASEIYNASVRGAASFNQLLYYSSKSIVILVVSYISVFVFAGDRGGPLQVVITILLLYSSRISSIGILRFCAIGVIGAIILSILGIFRSSGADGVASAQVNNFYDLTINLANSARTIYIGLSVVPESIDYFYGKMWLGNILGVFPFFQSIYLDLTGDKAYILNSANFITYLRYGDHPTTGEGTALIVDIFLNFGTIGVAFFMSLFGVFCKFLQSKAMSSSNFRFILMFALVGCTSLYMGRATYFIYLQTLVWGVLFVMIFSKRKDVF